MSGAPAPLPPLRSPPAPTALRQRGGAEIHPAPPTRMSQRRDGSSSRGTGIRDSAIVWHLSDYGGLAGCDPLGHPGPMGTTVDRAGIGPIWSFPGRIYLDR